MAGKRSSIMEDARVRRALANAVKSLRLTSRSKAVAAVAAALVVVAVAWLGNGAPPASQVEEPAGPTASRSSLVENAASVSDAAYRAASRDAEHATDVQRGNLDPSLFDRATVRHVVDGDTIAVAIEDGDHVSVRLIGIDTPESVAPQEERNCIEGSLASDHMKELVGEGDVLWLQYDMSVSDRYGRLLAYAWRNLPDSVEAVNDPEVIARDMLNAIQVIDGYGQARTYRPDTYHDRLFAQWGAEALADARGVTAKWA